MSNISFMKIQSKLTYFFDNFFLFTLMDLNLIFSGSPSVYRWYGTHLDEENRNLMIQASAVSTFPFQESVIIVVAVGASSNQKVNFVCKYVTTFSYFYYTM